MTLRVLQTRAAARNDAGARPFTLRVSVDGKLPAQAAPAAAAATGKAAPAAKAAAPGKAPVRTTAAAGTTCEGSGTLNGGSANLSGRLSGADVCTYAVTAQKGQTMRLLLDAPAGVEVMVRAPGEATAMPLVPEQPETVAVSGPHDVIVGRTRNDARKGGSRDFSAVIEVE